MKDIHETNMQCDSFVADGASHDSKVRFLLDYTHLLGGLG